MANLIGHLRNALLVFMFVKMSVSDVTDDVGHHTPPCRRQQTFYVCKNRVLKNFAYTTKTPVSRVICGRDCSADQKCKSFNFFNNNSTCMLNSATNHEQPSEFLGHQGSEYFDRRTFSSPSSLENCQNCQSLLKAGFDSSGVYTIYPDGCARDGFQVYCDMKTDGGGWIVFQRRQDGSVDFYRNWAEYKSGFGDPAGEFWLGNDNLAKLTTDSRWQGKWELRVDLQDWNGASAWAKYGDLKISGDSFTLHVDTYDLNSTAGDALGYHNDWPFATKDNDNYRACAKSCKGAWRFYKCDNAHLNGVYFSDADTGNMIDGILWDT